MAPFLSRNMGVSPAIALHIPSPRSPFSCATSVATLTTTALSRTGLSANTQSPSTAVFSCFAVKWKLDDRRARFRFAASVGVDKAPGDEHQVNHLLGPVIRSLRLCKKVLHPGIFRMHCYFKEKRSYLVWHNSSEGFHLSTDVSDSCDQQFLKVDNVELRKDKLLIDCDADQECVTGGIVALGKFDALHIGHRELAIQASKAGTPFLLSFVGMAEVLGWDYRAPVVAKCDRERVLSFWAPYCRDFAPLEFHVEFSKVRHLTPRQFVERLAKELRISGVVAGENYRFGYKATGDASELVRLCKEYGLEAYIVSPVLDGKSNNLNKREWVSSTRVRQALAVGDVTYVSELLGRKHRLVLTVNDECVVEGNRICVPKTCMLNQQPKDGLYESCSLLIGGIFVGPCRVVIDARNIYMELERTDGWTFPNWSRQLIGIEFG